MDDEEEKESNLGSPSPTTPYETYAHQRSVSNNKKQTKSLIPIAEKTEKPKTKKHYVDESDYSDSEKTESEI